MRIELLVNLKTTHGGLIPRGSIFTDEYKPIPGTILRKIGTPLVRVLPDTPISQPPVPQIIEPEEAVTMEAPEPKQSEIFAFQQEPSKNFSHMEQQSPSVEEAASDQSEPELSSVKIRKPRVRRKVASSENEKQVSPPVEVKKTTKTTTTKTRRRRRKKSE